VGSSQYIPPGIIAIGEKKGSKKSGRVTTPHLSDDSHGVRAIVGRPLCAGTCHAHAFSARPVGTSESGRSCGCPRPTMAVRSVCPAGVGRSALGGRRPHQNPSHQNPSLSHRESSQSRVWCPFTPRLGATLKVARKRPPCVFGHDGTAPQWCRLSPGTVRTVG